MTARDRVGHWVTGSVPVPGPGSHLGDPVTMLLTAITNDCPLSRLSCGRGCIR